ncbi:hypothetical protein [Natronospora cellulosivora (SeqCode)]
MERIIKKLKNKFKKYPCVKQHNYITGAAVEIDHIDSTGTTKHSEIAIQVYLSRFLLLK